ncbi:MAG: hypothetical protein KDE31_33445, partial [Caldilineaceae bacterium]|nr:hypothetical protein [Caldilineaceae bacterium]
MAVDTKSYVPDFAIKIKGKPFRLGADGAPIQHDKLTPIRDARLDVLSVSVTESTDKSDNCQIRLRGRLSELQRFPSGDELLWIDDDLFTEGNKIEIEMGYVGNRALHFVGEITALSVSFADNGVPTLSVEGQSLYHRLHRGRQDGPLEPMSDSDIVKKIAGQCKLKPSVEPTEVKHSTVAYAGKTFHTILQDRAKRTGCEVAVKGETLYFQKPGYQTKKSAKLSLTWGKDLLNFSARLKTTNVPTTVAVRGTMTNKGGPKEGVSATVNVASRP